MKKNPYRLEKVLRPRLYELSLRVDIEKFQFDGREVLEFDLLKPTKTLVLHGADLKVLSASLRHPSMGRESIEVQKIRYDKKFETVTFQFTKKLKKAQKVSLEIIYQGELNDQMHGFYRTSYSVDGQKRWGAATQFEATDARRAFICIDEPDAKARFRVSLTVNEALTALSNMPVIRESKDSPGKKTLDYETTPVMSTYLLCFVVAELECVETRDGRGVPVRVWTTPGRKEQGRFALEVAVHALEYFADWFDIPYAFPKLDMVALPDFASGAMENWGLVTYRETALLVDEKNSSAQAKQRVAEVIDHELAHQWFGNLVTMEWWTDLWLNEGFASYMGPKAVDHRFPEWKLWDQYVSAELLTALHDDALKNSHPIEIPVKNPHEIREIFDHITYNKGSAVNRMLEHFLGEPKFREGLRKYLKKYAYANARTVDLWHALEKVSKQPVRGIMAGFTRQEGFPVIRAEKAEKNGRSVLRVSQQRFLFDGSADPKKLQWKVPLTLRFDTEPAIRTHLLAGKVLEVPLKSGFRWLKMNPGQTGFYRVRYSKDLMEGLLQAAEKKELAVADVLGLLDDAFSFVRAGQLSSVEMLGLLPRFRSWTEYNIWATVSAVLGSVEALLDSDGARARYHAFGADLLADVWRYCGWEKKPADSHSDVLMRSLVISRLGHFGDRAIIDNCRGLFAKHVQGTSLSPDLRGAVYTVCAEHGGAETLDQIRSLYEAASLQEEKVRLLRSMTRFGSTGQIRSVLEYSLSGQVRAQDAYVLLAGFGSNRKAREQAWDFVKDHWKELRAMYKSGSVGLLGHILEGASSGFFTTDKLKDVRSFFQKHPVPGTERMRRQVLELLSSNITWKKRDSQDLENWLK